MTNYVNTYNIVLMLYKDYSIKNFNSSIITQKEIDIKNDIIKILKEYEINSCDDIPVDLETETLDSTECDLQDDTFLENRLRTVEYSEDDEEHVKISEPERISIPLEDKIAAVKYWRSSKNKNRRFQSVKNRFRFVKNLSVLYRWERQIKDGGDRLNKLKYIQKHVFEKFRIAREKCLNVHDDDLRQWACVKAFELKLPFNASNTWLKNFKKKFRIVSRKITKQTTCRCVSESNNLQQSAQAFVNDITTYIKDAQLSDNQIFNADQSSFFKEIHSGRTLAFMGVKNVEAVVQSQSAVTHSYTIMPIISKSGILISPLFIVYPEVKGEFGVNVRKHMFQSPNIFTVASKSGKMGNPENKKFLRDVYLKNTPNETVLLLDSWTIHRNENIIREVIPSDKHVRTFIMPLKTTPMVQPLVKYVSGFGKFLF